MHKPVKILTQSFLLGLTAIALFTSLYMQYVAGLEPCALCAMQRACVIALCCCGLFAFFARGLWGHAILYAQCVFALFGLYFALRQLWLQSLPAHMEAVCLPGLELLVRYLPWRDLLKLMFLGSPACNEILWQAWGFSIAAWSALYFSVVGSGYIWLLVASQPVKAK